MKSPVASGKSLGGREQGKQLDFSRADPECAEQVDCCSRERPGESPCSSGRGQEALASFLRAFSLLPLLLPVLSLGGSRVGAAGVGLVQISIRGVPALACTSGQKPRPGRSALIEGMWNLMGPPSWQSRDGITEVEKV